MERRGKAIEAQKNLMALTLSPDGGRLAAYDPEKKTAIAWDTITGEQKGSLALGGSKLGNMAFSVDGRTLAVGTEEDTIILWNIADGSQAQWSLTGDEKTPVRSIAFSRDGKSVAVGTRTRNGRIILFDITKGPLRSGVVLVSLDVIQDVAFDNEGSRLISTNYQGDVIVWDLDVGKWIQRALDKANLKLTAEEKRQLLN
jgi:WD40 repeat protein